MPDKKKKKKRFEVGEFEANPFGKRIDRGLKAAGFKRVLPKKKKKKKDESALGKLKRFILGGE